MSGGVVPGEPEFLYLTTTGYRSGQPREIEIGFTSRDGALHGISVRLNDSCGGTESKDCFSTQEFVGAHP